MLKSVAAAAVALLAGAGCSSSLAKQVPAQPQATFARVTPQGYSPAGPIARSAAPAPRTIAHAVATPAPFVASTDPSGRSFNATCPVLVGNPVDPRINSTWNGRQIAFSTTTAKLMWDADPSRYAANLPGVSGSASDSRTATHVAATSTTSVSRALPSYSAARVLAPAPCAVSSRPVVAALPVVPAPCAAKPAPAVSRDPAAPAEPVVAGDCDECPGGNCRIPGR